jgi:MFS family permease
MRDALRNPAMLRLHAAWFLSIAAEWAFTVALLVLAYGIGGVLAASLVTTLRMLPPVLGAPIAVTVTDRLPGGMVLAVVHALRAVVVAACGAVLAFDLSPVLLFVAAPVEGLLAVLRRPATLSLLPALARSPEELVAGNAITTFGEGLGVLLGPIVGSILLAVAGLEVAVTAPAIGLAAAALLAATIRVPARRAAVARGPLRELVDGFSALRRHPTAGLVIGLFGAQTFVRGLLTVLLVAASVELLGLGEEGVGWLTAAIGAGGLVGALATTAWMAGGSLGATFSVALAVWGLPIALVGVLAAPWLAALLLAVVGLANAVLDVAGFTLLQRCVPTTVRSRVFGALEGVAALTFAAGSLVAAPLVDVAGVAGALAVAGAILPVLAVVTAAAVQRGAAATVVPERELGLLRGDPLFAPLSLVVLEHLAQSMDAERVPAGTAIVSQGEAGDAYRILGDGSAEVSRDGRALRRIGPGDGFGEIALLEDRPRTASVVALEDAVVHRLPREAFLEAVTGTPASAAAASHLVTERLAALDA